MNLLTSITQSVATNPVTAPVLTAYFINIAIMVSVLRWLQTLLQSVNERFKPPYAILRTAEQNYHGNSNDHVCSGCAPQSHAGDPLKWSQTHHSDDEGRSRSGRRRGQIFEEGSWNANQQDFVALHSPYACTVKSGSRVSRELDAPKKKRRTNTEHEVNKCQYNLGIHVRDNDAFLGLLFVQ